MNKIFECQVGSHCYGTNIPTSDVDIKGVYLQSNDDILGLKYQEQLNPDKDTSYYEVRRFIELAGSANPTMLEMLFVDDKFIKKCSPEFGFILLQRDKFLTKQCKNSFGGFAVQQIKKAQGLNKKINWEKSKVVRKTPLDFCFIHQDGKSVNIVDWLKRENLKQEFIGLCALDRMPGCYSIYYDYSADYGQSLNKPIPPIGYRGIAFEDSNAIRLSSIPKEQLCLGVMYYNQSAYSLHCKEFNEYSEWLKKSNPQRRIDTQKHGQQIDGKNLMHCMRLINCGLEIATQGKLTVFRPEAEELLKIRRGECVLEDVIKECEAKLILMEEAFDKADLPDGVTLDFKHDLILKCRR